MSYNYTQEASDRFFDFFDRELHTVWDDIENTPESTDPADWKNKINGIAREYALSSRFALMRILYSRSNNGSLEKLPESSSGFDFTWNDHKYSFSALSIKQAEALSLAELADYKSAFLDIASYRADFDMEVSKEVLGKALASGGKKRITRSDAFLLGHILGFSLTEMQWFLLRVFDEDEGFQYNRSEDVIEAYTFKTKTPWFSWKTAALMKRAYKRYQTGKQIAHIRGSAWAPSIEECYRQVKCLPDLDRSKTPKEAISEIMRAQNSQEMNASCEQIQDFLLEHINSAEVDRELIYALSGNVSALAELHVGFFENKKAKDPKRKAQIYAEKKIAEITVSDFLELCRITSFEEETLIALADGMFSYDDIVSFHFAAKENPNIYAGTAEMESNLDSITQKNELAPDEDILFLKWMVQDNRRYDYPSKTAGQIYRKLAVYAVHLLTGKNGTVIPTENDDGNEIICDGILKAIREGSQYLLYKDNNISPERCEKAASTLLSENAELSRSVQTDISKAWGIITTLNTGEATASGSLNANRMRVLDLLMGKERVQKCDILYLLFFIFNISWQVIPSPDNNTICNRVFDFIETSAACLQEALLPEFYPPHLLEQSLLLSIVSANNAITDPEDDISVGAGPAQVYQIICESLRGSRNRQKTETQNMLN